MKSLRELYRIGIGPSSSHTMAPHRAAENFIGRYPSAPRYRVTLFGSLAATGKGHLTDRAILDVLGDDKTALIWKPNELLPRHPNALRFEALDTEGALIAEEIVYSIGGGALLYEDEQVQANEQRTDPYPYLTMRSILPWAEREGRQLWEYVYEHEDTDFDQFLSDVWTTMKETIARGIENEGRLPGSLNLARKASSYFMKSRHAYGMIRQISKLFAYALAVSEENASGGIVVTAPTCGSCGVLPAVLKVLQEDFEFTDKRIRRALATAGLIGNLVKHNGSISGAEVGCQGEVGTACAMAAAAAAQLLGGTPSQVEYAAEMGLEHHLGLTCDPVEGLVQVPCIERNAVAATRAVDAGTFATLSDGKHMISFDEVVDTMAQTGKDLSSRYRETSSGGLSIFYNRDELEALAKHGTPQHDQQEPPPGV
ncbi:L-serine ammonia-lyase [Sediminispirochaeta bajacaliforniensis]|uniref:L-serine ammonia-lyase n=1 Tax=Sediminispirochaeta bajacaliforniensis TaxID=148 RepID=UPI00036CE41C|nr:L-serine ammonia-lyase [Sediminispirochaeta bajacaliforniensis]